MFPTISSRELTLLGYDYGKSARRWVKLSETAKSSAVFLSPSGTRQGLLPATPKQPQTPLAESPQKNGCANSDGLIVSESFPHRRSLIRLPMNLFPEVVMTYC